MVSCVTSFQTVNGSNCLVVPRHRCLLFFSSASLCYCIKTIKVLNAYRLIGIFSTNNDLSSQEPRKLHASRVHCCSGRLPNEISDMTPCLQQWYWSWINMNLYSVLCLHWTFQSKFSNTLCHRGSCSADRFNTTNTSLPICSIISLISVGQSSWAT